MADRDDWGEMTACAGLEGLGRKARLGPGQGSLFTLEAGARGRPVVLLVHGLGDECDTWAEILPRLAPDVRVLAPDLPGFGRSDPPRQGYTLAGYEEALLGLMDEAGVEKAALVGHSLGALLAHTLALRCPERVERLVLIGGSLAVRRQPLTLATLLFLIPGLGEWAYNRLRRDPQAAYQSLAPYYGRLEALPAARRDFLFRRVNQRVWSDRQREAFLGILRSMAREVPSRRKDLAARLGALQIPTLGIWGDQDRLSPVENGRYLVELQPSARLVIVPGAGHNVQQEAGEQVAEEIRRHLAGLMPGERGEQP